MAQLRTLVEAGLGVIFLDELATRVLHSSRKVTNATRKQFNACRAAFATNVREAPPAAATAILKVRVHALGVEQALECPRREMVQRITRPGALVCTRKQERWR